MMRTIGLQTTRESLHPNAPIQKTRRFVFFVGIFISAVGEMALIGLAMDMPLYQYDALGFGFDFVTALLILGTGNLLMLFECKLTAKPR